MQGIVTNERGAYVKAAIINLIRAKDSVDGSGAVDVTYAETDEEGRFVIQELNPDEKYIIEIRVKTPDTAVESKEAAEEEPEAEPESEHIDVKEPETVAYDPDLEDEEDLDLYEEEDGFGGELVFIDSLEQNNMIEDTVRENICSCTLRDPQGFLSKNKPYLIKNNLW